MLIDYSNWVAYPLYIETKRYGYIHVFNFNSIDSKQWPLSCLSCRTLMIKKFLSQSSFLSMIIADGCGLKKEKNVSIFYCSSSAIEIDEYRSKWSYCVRVDWNISGAAKRCRHRPTSSETKKWIVFCLYTCAFPLEQYLLPIDLCLMFGAFCS